MKNKIVLMVEFTALVLFVALYTSCNKDNPADSSTPSICFTVSGFNVRIDGVDYSYPANKCK